jgi:hypothetical protein
MKKIISRFFSDEYVKNSTTEQNLLLFGMYRFAYPFAFILNRLSISPNQITVASIIFSIMAAVSLVVFKNGVFFGFFWLLSLLLDFCDGTVARMSNNISKTALRFDHISDLFKLFIVILASAMYYNILYVWIASMCALFAFMYFMVLNHDLSNAQKLMSIETKTTEKIQNDPSSGKIKYVKRVIKSIFPEKILINISLVVLTINGHTLLIFLLLPLGKSYAVGVFIYFGLISIFKSCHCISALTKIPRKSLKDIS